MSATLRPALTPFPLDAVPAELQGGVVAVGNFDGVHRGHAALLTHARDEASRLGVPSVVLTFEPHPRTVFRPESPVPRLTPPEAKARVITALGVDGLVVANFDRAFAQTPADDFIEQVLRDRFRLKEATVGFDFQFGKGRGGTPEALKMAGERLGFNVEIIGPAREGDGAPFASTAVRAHFAAGEVAEANHILGYRWFVAGEVVSGDKRGRELGYPTANLVLPPETALRHGIYAVRVQRADGTIHDGVASYGRRPTFDNGAPLLESFLFDFSGDLYGERIAVSLIGWIRPELKFDSAEALIVAMDGDSVEARRILAAAGPGTPLDQALAHIAA